MPTRLIDLSHPLTASTPPFPGDPPVEITILDETAESGREEREHLNCSRIATCVHCGTHMDAPYHFFGDGATIEGIALEVCVGPAVLADLGELAPEAEITPALLQPFERAFRETRRLVLSTGWSRRWLADDYFTRHPVITAEATALLVAAGVRLVGVDFPSVDRPPHPAHLELLGNGIVIVENLTNLDAIAAERFELTALPLALTGRDGSPVRAVARVDGGA